ncbi:MAG: hypothetical protein J7599_19270 [Niabella sp.]|nr:hypothetical protein [Niabella sp.]
MPWLEQFPSSGYLQFYMGKIAIKKRRCLFKTPSL